MVILGIARAGELPFRKLVGLRQRVFAQSDRGSESLLRLPRTSWSASSRVIRPSSRAVISATSRLPFSIARVKVDLAEPCAVNGPPVGPDGSFSLVERALQGHAPDGSLTFRSGPDNDAAIRRTYQTRAACSKPVNRGEREVR
jgi:hypothetical protein